MHWEFLNNKYPNLSSVTGRKCIEMQILLTRGQGVKILIYTEFQQFPNNNRSINCRFFNTVWLKCQLPC